MMAWSFAFFPGLNCWILPQKCTKTQETQFVLILHPSSGMVLSSYCMLDHKTAICVLSNQDHITKPLNGIKRRRKSWFRKALLLLCDFSEKFGKRSNFLIIEYSFNIISNGYFARMNYTCWLDTPKRIFPVVICLVRCFSKPPSLTLNMNSIGHFITVLILQRNFGC